MPQPVGFSGWRTAKNYISLSDGESKKFGFESLRYFFYFKGYDVKFFYIHIVELKLRVYDSMLDIVVKIYFLGYYGIIPHIFKKSFYFSTYSFIRCIWLSKATIRQVLRGNENDEFLKL